MTQKDGIGNVTFMNVVFAATAASREKTGHLHEATTTTTVQAHIEISFLNIATAAVATASESINPALI